MERRKGATCNCNSPKILHILLLMIQMATVAIYNKFVMTAVLHFPNTAGKIINILNPTLNQDENGHLTIFG